MNPAGEEPAVTVSDPPVFANVEHVDDVRLADWRVVDHAQYGYSVVAPSVG
jgi:hypothetical protein